MVLMAGKPGEKNIPSLRMETCNAFMFSRLSDYFFVQEKGTENNLPDHALVIYEVQNMFCDRKVSITRKSSFQVPEEAGLSITVPANNTHRELLRLTDQRQDTAANTTTTLTDALEKGSSI